MKRSLTLVGLVFLSVFALRADLVVVQKVDGVGHVVEMTLKIKDNLMRTDISPEMSAITDLNTGSVTTLMHKQKMCMRIDGDQTRKLMENIQKLKGPKKDAAQGDVKLTATGKKETVNGFDTEIYIFKAGNLSMKFWLAKDFPQADKFRAAFKQMQNSPMALMARKMASPPTDLSAGVPVKTEIDDPSSRTKITTTIVSVNEQPLNASEFAVPADYQTIPMPSFGAGAGPGAPEKGNPQPEQ